MTSHLIILRCVTSIVWCTIVAQIACVFEYRTFKRRDVVGSSKARIRLTSHLIILRCVTSIVWCTIVAQIACVFEYRTLKHRDVGGSSKARIRLTSHSDHLDVSVVSLDLIQPLVPNQRTLLSLSLSVLLNCYLLASVAPNARRVPRHSLSVLECRLPSVAV